MRSSRFNLWAKFVKLAKSRREKNRKRLLFRSSLVEQFEKRELMAYSVSSIQLVNDTGISSTDKITYDPTLSGSVSNSTGGTSGGHGGGGYGGGYGGSGVLHVQFDHNGDGVGDGSVIVNGTSFQYDPRISDPGLYFQAGAINIKQRVLEYNYMNQLVSTGSWSDFNFTLETAASGEIQVRDNHQNVLISQTNFDFGAVEVGTAVSRTFTIDNLASPMNPAAVLRLKTTDIQVPPGYSITQAYAGTVSPGQQTSFIVTLNTSTPGPKWGTFSFKNSDGDENPFTLNFTANVLSIEPEIDIKLESSGQTIADNTGSLAFGSTEVGTPVQRQIRISNQGNSPLTLGAPSVGSGFTITSFVPNSLAANSSVLVTLQMNAANAGTFDVPFSITSNDGNESPYNFALTGTVTNVAPPYVENFSLFHDTGVSTSDRITTDPRLYGIARGSFQGGTARIEFDHHRTGTINGSLIVTNSGDSFTYDPRVTDSTIAERSGRWTLRYRVVHLSSNGETLATGNWIDFAMILDGIAETAGLSLSQFGLVRDTGSSVIDRLTTDPTIQATLTGDRAGGKVRLEFDHQGNGAVTKYVEFPAGVAQVQYDPRSGDAGLIGHVGATEFRYRLTKLDANDNPISSSRWITFAYELAALPSSTIEVRNFRLAHDTGSSDSDRVTSDPTITGNLHDTASVPASTGFTLVQFDHNGDGVPDGSALTDGLGVFTYRPRGLSYNSHTLRVRSTPYSVEYASYLIGPWASLSMQLIAPPAPKIESLALVSDTGTSSTDKVTDNPTIVGTIKLEDRPVSDYLVYVDHNGDGTTEGTAITDQFGNFIYRPRNLTPGPIKLKLLTAYWDSNLNSTVYASPVEFEYTLLPPPLPSIEWLDIAIDDGADRLDRRTTHSMIVGQLGTSSLFQNIQVEFDHDNNGTVDGIAFSDASGAILYRPFGLAPGSVTMKARPKIWNVDQVQWNTGAWATTQFTLEASASSSLGIGSLGLRRDTGTSTSDLVTSEATVAGQIQYSGSAAAASLGGLANQRVEFDENGDNEVDGYTFTEADGKFLYTPKFLNPGAKAIRARTRSWNTQTHQGELSAWSTLNFTLGVDPVIAPAVQSLALLSDSGISATDGITRNPAFTGVIPLPSGMTGGMLEIDFNNDGVSDTLTTTDSNGRFVVHPNFSTFGPKTVAVRSFVYRPDSTAREFSNWQTLSFNYSDEPSQPASITSLQWTPATRTASPVLKGRIIDDSNVANVQIEIDLNDDGIAEAVVTSDSQGRFEYTYVPPTTSSPSSVTLKLRTKQAITGASPQIGSWSAHTFSNPAPSTPTPSSLGAWGLANDDGTSATDRISTDLTLKGSIQAGSNTGRLEDQLIQFDHDGDGKPDGSTLTDTQGNFTYPLSLAVGEHTVKTRLISFDPDLGLIQGAWSSLVVTQSVLVETKIATLGLVSDTGNAGDGATANVALQGTLTGPSVGHVLIFIDVNGDGTPEGHATTNASGAFAFTPEVPSAEGFVQATAWIARGGAPGDSTSKTHRFVYSSAPNGTTAQALVTQLASFDSAWQSANTTLQQGLTAAQNALKTSLQNADSTYRTEISAAYNLFQSTRLSSVTAYRDSLRSAEFQLNTSLSAAESNFLNQTSGQAQGTDPLFVWPVTPPEDAFVIPKDEDQPQPPAYFGIDAGPTLNVGQHPGAIQLYAIAESNAATALATAEATYQQALASAAAAAAQAKQTAYQQFASSVSTARNARAAAEANLQHPTLNAAAESRQSAIQLQAQRDLKSSVSVAAQQEFSNKAQTAFNKQASAVTTAQQARESEILAAWAAFNQGVMYTYGNPGALQALIATRDGRLRTAHETYFRKLADAAFDYTNEVALAAKQRDFAIAAAEHQYEVAVANLAKPIRDVAAYIEHWINAQKITAAHNEEKETALASEQRARSEAEAKHTERVSQINAAYAKVIAAINAEEEQGKANGATPVSVLSPFAGFIGSVASDLQLADAQSGKKEADAIADAKADRDRAAADKAKQLALVVASEALQFAYRLAEADRIASIGIADKKKALRDQANDAVKQLSLDRSAAIHSEDLRESLGRRIHREKTAQTAYEYAVDGATPTKNRAYEMAIPEAFKQVFPNSTTSYYGRATAEATYNYEMAMITVDKTHRQNQADDHHDQITGIATDEATTTIAWNALDHSVRSLLIQHLSSYDSLVTSIIATAITTEINSSATYSNNVLDNLLSMDIAISELDRLFGEAVADAALDREVETITNRSEKNVQTYEIHRDRVSLFANSLGSPWGNMHLKKADASLQRESAIKQATLIRAADDSNSQRNLVSDYLQEVKTTTDTEATGITGYDKDVIAASKSYGLFENNEYATYYTVHSDLWKTFQIAISQAYTVWQNRTAEIKRDKVLREAAAELTYRRAEASALETVEPDFATARRDLAIASAQYGANEINAAQWQQAQTTYAAAITTANQRLAQLLAQPALTRRTSEGEAIKLREIETATAEQGWVQSSSSAYLSWVQNSGNQTKSTSSNLESAGGTFVTTEADKAKTTNATLENASKGFTQSTAADKAEFFSELTAHSNTLTLKLANIQGDWLHKKVDARSEYEWQLAETHKLRKESLHQLAPTDLTTLQSSIAFADSVKYAQRRVGFQQRATDWKSETVQLTSSLNQTAQQFVDQSSSVDLALLNGTTNAAATVGIDYGTSETTLQRDLSKADLKRHKEELAIAVDSEFLMAQAEVADALRVQAAKVVQATAVGEALKQKHIDQYTAAAIAAAETRIATANSQFKASEKASKVIMAGDMGDVVISAATASANVAVNHATEWNNHYASFTSSANTADTTYTSSVTSAKNPWLLGSKATHNSADMANANAYINYETNKGNSDVNWITSIATADATRIATQAAAQGSWVTQQTNQSNPYSHFMDAAAASASLDWAKQYAPSRTSLIAATANADALRQKAYLQGTVDLAVEKSEADRDYLSSLTGPDLSYLTNDNANENSFSNATRNASNTAYTQIDTNRANARMEMVIAQNAANVAAATAWKAFIVAGVSLPEGQSAEPVHKQYKDAMALINRDAKTAYALTSRYLATANASAVNAYLATENSSEHTLAVQQAASADAHADTSANLYKQMQLDYQTAESDVRIDGTAADNVWRLTVSNQTVVSHRGDLVARGNARRTLANTSLSLADQSTATIAEQRVNWWDTQIVHYQQWNLDVSAIETNYTATVTANANQRKAALMAAELDLVDKTSDANRDYDTALSTANNTRLVAVRAANLTQVQAEANARYQRARAVAEAEYQLQVTGNQSNYNQAVAAATTQYDTTVQTANTVHEAAVKAATEQQNEDVAEAAVLRDEAIAAAQKDFADIVAALNLQYGPESANGDTGFERIQRDTQLAQRDSQYVAQQESSWSSYLNASSAIGNNPWFTRAKATAAARSQHATAQHSSLVARDQAMLNAVDDLRDSLGGLESDFAEVQAILGQTFQNATSAAFATWDESFSNTLGQVPRVLRFVEPMLNAHDIALGAFVAGEVFTASRDVGAISFTGIADDLQDARRAVNRPAAAPERPTDNGNAEDLAKKKEEELKKAKEDEFVTGFKAGVMPAVAGGMIPMDDPFTNGFIKGFFLDGIGGDVQAVVDFANDPLKTARDTFNAMKYAESIAIGAVASLFTMNDSQQAAVAKAADHFAAEALIWTSLGQKLLTGQGQLSPAEINKVLIIADIANVIAGEISKAISDITPEDLGRIAGMIAYELAIETGITVAATVTAGAATTLSAARIALLTQKLKRLNRFGEKAAELLKADGKLVAKMKELFSELKANGKLDAAKHLDLLKIKCFSRDTLVHTATGPRPIGEIEPGEQIWSYHFERGVWGLCEVKERLDNTYSGPVISITVDNTTIEATAYHPFWVTEGRDLRERSKPRELQEHEDEGHSLPGRWVNSHELRAGDCIITRSGTRALITEIRQRFDDAFPVSNLSIIGHHNYAVGDVGVLVHNKPVCDETIAELREARADGTSDDEIRDLLRSKTDDKGHRLYDESEIDTAIEKISDPYWPWKIGKDLVDSKGNKIAGNWTDVREIGKRKADAYHDLIRDRLRKENEGYESGRHNMYPRAMVRAIDEEIKRVRNSDLLDAEKQAVIKRLEEIRKTYERRAGAGHRGGGVGS